MQNTFLILILLTMMNAYAVAQQPVPLYPGVIPNSKESPDEETTETNKDGIVIVSKISKPTLTAYLPKQTGNDARKRTAVIICPGGGYWVNAIKHEGTDVAQAFAEKGVVAFVLKYRIPNDKTMDKREIGPLQDLQQAIAVVRLNASQWNVDPAKIGVMGFSAGGHLASTAGTHFKQPSGDKLLDVRPSFMILIYPVITFRDGVGHMGSRDQLLGKSPSKARIEYFSNELQVTPETPPAFLVHASDDDGVKVDNAILFYQSLRKNNVPAELHIYQAGGHGFGMVNKTTDDAWMERCFSWMRSNKWME